MSSFIKQYFCNHNWEEKYRSSTYNTSESKFPYKIEITLVCNKCGKIKQMCI